MALVMLLLMCVADAASAKSHLWRFKEIFSNADGTIQYIEMDVTDPAGTGEWVTGGYSVTSNASEFVIPTHLPQENTYLRSMLLATADFAALPGAPTPDFEIPASFFDPSGDTLAWRTSIDIWAFTTPSLPTDGIHALQRSDGSQPVNSPTNFAGETGTVNASPGIGVGDELAWRLLLAALLGMGAFMALERRPGVSSPGTH